jgi:hypothetical protein
MATTVPAAQPSQSAPPRRRRRRRLRQNAVAVALHHLLGVLPQQGKLRELGALERALKERRPGAAARRAAPLARFQVPPQVLARRCQRASRDRRKPPAVERDVLANVCHEGVEQVRGRRRPHARPARQGARRRYFVVEEETTACKACRGHARCGRRGRLLQVVCGAGWGACATVCGHGVGVAKEKRAPRACAGCGPLAPPRGETRCVCVCVCAPHSPAQAVGCGCSL